MVPTPKAGAQGKNLQRLLSNDGDTFTAVQPMKGCNHAGAMEVQLGAHTTTTRRLVLLWWIMPLRGKVPRDSWLVRWIRADKVGSPGGSAVP